MRRVKLFYAIGPKVLSIFVLIYIIILASYQVGAQPVTDNSSKVGYIPYENQLLKIKLHYPNNMQKLDLGNEIIFKALENNSNIQNENFTISVRNLPSDDMTLNDYTESQEAELLPLNTMLLEATTVVLIIILPKEL